MSRRAFDAAVTAMAFVTCAGGAGVSVSRAQEAGSTVADQVYTDAQAARGAGVYDATCSGCHRADLGGNTGPALRDERFTRQFAGKDLRTLFTRIATTMPRNAPASLGDNAYLDVVAYMLKENGFPSGSRELVADALDAIRVLPGRPKPPPPVGDFSYVELVGCVSSDSRDGAAGSIRWMLTRASNPAAATASDSATAPARMLGSQTVYLVDAMAYAPDQHKNQKVYVRGLLVRVPGEQRMMVSALETVSPTCSE
jgi:cytochrome c5